MFSDIEMEVFFLQEMKAKIEARIAELTAKLPNRKNEAYTPKPVTLSNGKVVYIGANQKPGGGNGRSQARKNGGRILKAAAAAKSGTGKI